MSASAQKTCPKSSPSKEFFAGIVTGTIVVNTIVVMEIFYLFSVRYLHGTSLTWIGIVGTPAVLAGVGTVIAAQFVFTYAPFMHGVFATRPVSLADGVNIVILGIVFFAILELDKLVRRRLRFLAD